MVLGKDILKVKKQLILHIVYIKKSFFKFDFHESHRLSVGMHWLFPHAFKSWKFKGWNKYNKFISYNENVNILAHFKFVKRDFEKYLEKRIERNHRLESV